MRDPYDDGVRAAPTPTLREHLADLQTRLERARGDAAPDETHARLVADLETAYEELRVADEEVRTQQEEISRLLEGRNLLRWQQERMMASLPVATLTTDVRGTIRTVNAAAASMLDQRVASLLGKPVLTLFAVEERPAMRRLVAEHARTGTPLHTRSVVRRRDGSMIAVEATATTDQLTEADDPGAGLTTWMIFDARESVTGVVRRQLPAVLSRLAALPATVEGLQDLLTQAAALCHEALGPGVELTVSVGAPEKPDALASTDRVAQLLDGAQIARAEGPCVDAYATAAMVITPDVRSDPRWPRLRDDVPDHIGAVLAVPLETGARLVGALNIYGTAGTTLDDLVDTAELLAATLAAVLHELGLKVELRDLASDMERALTSRAVIDQAKGIIMSELGCTADEAFAHLVELSSSRQVKLREVARELVERRTGGR